MVPPRVLIPLGVVAVEYSKRGLQGCGGGICEGVWTGSELGFWNPKKDGGGYWEK